LSHSAHPQTTPHQGYLGRKTLVTGAASGIGRAIALAREAHGWRRGRDPHLRSHARRCDHRRRRGAARGLLHILVQQRGRRLLRAERTDDGGAMGRASRRHLLAPAQLVRELLPGPGRAGGGAHPQRLQHFRPACAAQGRRLSRSLCAEYGRASFGVTALCPRAEAPEAARRVRKVTVDNQIQLSVEPARILVSLSCPRIGAFPPLTWPRASGAFLSAVAADMRKQATCRTMVECQGPLPARTPPAVQDFEADKRTPTGRRSRCCGARSKAHRIRQGGAWRRGRSPRSQTLLRFKRAARASPQGAGRISLTHATLWRRRRVGPGA